MDGTLPSDPKEASKLRARSTRFTIHRGTLYKRGFSTPILKCVGKEDANYVLREVHEGICGNHIGARSLAAKTLRHGYYWPTILIDATEPVKKMQDLSRAYPYISPPIRAANLNHKPLALPTVGLDLLGPLPIGKGQCKFIVVGVGYFTKWAEAEPLAIITEQKVRNFVWRSIICRFGIPKALVFDNGKQFDNPKVKDFCDEFGIKNYYSSPAHPQASGQAEVTIRTLKAALKTKLENLKGKWVEYLPEVLWAYRTTCRSATQETPFALAFGTKEVASVEVGLKSPSVEFANTKHKEEILRLNLDLLEEKREQTLKRAEDYHRKRAKYYDRRVRPRSFKFGDLVPK